MNRPCDVCGEPSILVVSDTVRIERLSDTWASEQPIGLLRAGCALHPVKSKTYFYASEVPQAARWWTHPEGALKFYRDFAKIVRGEKL